MRWSILLLSVAALLASAPVGAQQGRPIPAADAQTPGLRVSLTRVRQALQQAPVEPLKGLNEHPTFKKGLDGRPTFQVQVQERQKFRDSLSTPEITSGPVPPGGLYAYEFQQAMTPRIYQTYAVCDQRELRFLGCKNYLEDYILGPVIRNISETEQARARHSARNEVDRGLTSVLAAHTGAAAANTP